MCIFTSCSIVLNETIHFKIAKLQIDFFLKKLYLIIIENKKCCFSYVFCIPINFNKPLKVCFTTQTPLTQIVKVYFLLKNRFLTEF